VKSLLRQGFAVAAILGSLGMLGACQHKTAAQQLAQLETRVQQLETLLQAVKPGLGDIMLAVQEHHIKVWYAGQGRNWALAKFELDEIAESFAEATQVYPDFQGVPVAKLLPANTQKAMADLGQAIEKRNPAQFAAAYDALSLACSSCHQQAQRPFIRLQRPGPGQFSDQVFHP